MAIAFGAMMLAAKVTQFSQFSWVVSAAAILFFCFGERLISRRDISFHDETRQIAIKTVWFLVLSRTARWSYASVNAIEVSPTSDDFQRLRISTRRGQALTVAYGRVQDDDLDNLASQIAHRCGLSKIDGEWATYR